MFDSESVVEWKTEKKGIIASKNLLKS